MARKQNSRPYRCPKCQAEGSIYGRLVFDGDEPGNCPHHVTTPLVPSPRPMTKAAVVTTYGDGSATTEIFDDLSLVPKELVRRAFATATAEREG